MVTRRTLFLALCFSACAREPARSPVVATAPNVPAGAATGRSRYDVASVARAGSVYRSGSRLKIRWIEPIGDSSVALPYAIYDSKLGTECTLADGPEATCTPVGETVDDENIAFLAPDWQSPALVVPDDECRAPQTTADDRHLWALPDLASTARTDPESRIRYRLDAPRIANDAWTEEGPDCVVTLQKNARTPLCVRPFRAIDTSDVVHVKETVFGKDGSGALLEAGSDGSILPRGDEAAAFDGRHGFECSVDAHSDRCLPAPYDRIATPPMVGATVVVDNFIGQYSSWGNFENGDRTIFAELSPADPNGSNRQSRRILALLDDGGVMRLPSRIEGKNRIGLHSRAMPDGRNLPFSFHDASLDRDCHAAQTDDGTWRCVVTLDTSCDERTYVGADDREHDALTGSSSFCRKDGTCCAGGPIWFPSHAARGPRRFGMDASVTHPAIPERAALFSETGHLSNAISGWQPQIQKVVYDKIRDLPADTFAPMRLVQDP